MDGMGERSEKCQGEWIRGKESDELIAGKNKEQGRDDSIRFDWIHLLPGRGGEGIEAQMRLEEGRLERAAWLDLADALEEAEVG